MTVRRGNLNPINIQNFGVPGITQSQRTFFNNKFSYPGYIDPSTGQTLMCCGTANNIMGNWFGNDANSSYNALQVKVQSQMSHGLQFIAHYTWSRALNYNNVGYFEVNPRVAYGPDDQNRPQVFVLNLVYQLPFGKGKAFGGNAGKAGEPVYRRMAVHLHQQLQCGSAVHSQLQRVQLDKDVGVCWPNKGNLANWSMGGGSYNNLTHTVTFFTPQPLGNAWLEPHVGTLGQRGQPLPERTALVHDRRFDHEELWPDRALQAPVPYGHVQPV